MKVKMHIQAHVINSAVSVNCFDQFVQRQIYAVMLLACWSTGSLVKLYHKLIWVYRTLPQLIKSDIHTVFKLGVNIYLRLYVSLIGSCKYNT